MYTRAHTHVLLYFFQVNITYYKIIKKNCIGSQWVTQLSLKSQASTIFHWKLYECDQNSHSHASLLLVSSSTSFRNTCATWLSGNVIKTL